MFQLTAEGVDNLRYQNGTSSWGGRRYSSYAFTEQGVVMLSSVLRSKRAVMVNIEIMRGGELRHTYKRRNVSERPSIAWYDLSNSRR